MLKLLGDCVIILFVEIEEKFVGGFVFVGVSYDVIKIVKVFVVGDGICILIGELVVFSVVEGDIVLVENGVGLEVKDGNEKVIVVCESDIVVVVK